MVMINLSKKAKWISNDCDYIKLPDGDTHLTLFKSADQKHLFQITNLGRIYEIVVKKKDKPKLMRVL